MKGIIILLGASLFWITSCAQQTQEASEKSNNTSVETAQQSNAIIKRVSKEEFKQVLADNPDAVLVDVRTPNEYSRGKIGEAINIDFLDPSFESNINKLDKTKLTLIYCQSAGRSAKALAKMKELGFEHVLELAGGYGRL